MTPSPVPAVRRALILPHVVRLGLQAPRDPDTRWEHYWSATRETGDGGDVLWDSSTSGEADRYLDLLAEYADLTRPVVDLGCGNGRFTRALAGRFARAIGIDVAPAAVARARAEADGSAAEFRVGNLTDPELARALHAELGDCTVFVRGVLHVLDAADTRRAAQVARILVGDSGVVLVAETDYRGPLLGYLESLGAGPAGVPAPLARALTHGLPRPHPFGSAELRAAFPGWHHLLDDATARISTVPMRTTGVPDSVPGHLAVLRPR